VTLLLLVLQLLEITKMACDCTGCRRLDKIYNKSAQSKETLEQEDIAKRWRGLESLHRTEEKRLGA